MSDESGVSLPDRIGIGVLTRLIPRDLVDEVLAETGRVERRRRLLPARVVVYYVMALCLFFGEAYEEVMRKLVGGLQWLRGWDTHWQVPTASALCQARQRLGVEPMRALFDRVAQPMLPTGGGRGARRQRQPRPKERPAPTSSGRRSDHSRGAQSSATDRPASRRATGTRNGEQET